MTGRVVKPKMQICRDGIVRNHQLTSYNYSLHFPVTRFVPRTPQNGHAQTWFQHWSPLFTKSLQVPLIGKCKFNVVCTHSCLFSFSCWNDAISDTYDMFSIYIKATGRGFCPMLMLIYEWGVQKGKKLAFVNCEQRTWLYMWINIYCGTWRTLLNNYNRC